MFKQLLPLTVAIMLPFSGQQAMASDPIPTINISATGKVVAAPDIAIVTSGVVTEGKTAREALSANNKAMTALIDVLVSAGVEQKHIQTSDFSVHPNYVHSNKRNENGYALPPKIDGYRVSNMVTVNVVNLDDLGNVLDQAVTVGANSINGVSFSVAQPTRLLDKAREKAIAEAIKNANIYAQAAGIELSSILSISEGSGYSPQPYANVARMDMMMSEAVPVQAGQLSYSITVNVSWQISN